MGPPSPPSPGDRIGRYALVRRLGRGGSGEVWEAVLEGPGGFRKPVALKLLRPRTGDTPRELLREARLGALLQHPNIVGTYAVGRHDGSWHVALELVRGPSVHDLVQRHGALPGNVVVEIGVQCAAALAHVHGLTVDGVPAGLVHRDVKPANLLVDPVGLVKLADLGISLLRGEQQDHAAGTLGYMPPEQADGRAEPRSDLFALGVTLYRLATGRRPFESALGAGQGVRASDDRMRDSPFLALPDAAVPGLGEVLRSCLCPDPAGRPADARALHDALSALRRRQAPGPLLAELVAEGIPANPSELPTQVLAGASALPAPRDPILGREVEVAAIAERVLDGDRLVVLCGTGGIGKTRLAVEVAHRVAASLAGGATMFDLTDARRVDDICTVVAAGLGAQLGSDPIAQVGRSLAARGRALFVLDNVEGCLAHLPATVGRWCLEAPAATFLATSRVATRLAGEVVAGVGTLGTDAALALLVARCPRDLADDERADAARISADLDGVPLAIELAAARLARLPARDVRARLGLALLSGGGPERPERHRSLAASLAGSYEALSDGGRTALGDLAVFDGGFTLAAAEAVIAPTADGSALDALQELVDGSLVQADPGRGRFRLLAVVRAFASEQPTGRAIRSAERRHGAFFAQAGTPEAIAALHGPDGADRLAALGPDLDNLVAACRRALLRGDVGTALPTLRAAWEVFALRGPTSTGATLSLELARVARAPRDRAAAAALAARAMWVSARVPEARRFYEEALAGFRALGDRRAEADVLNPLGELRRVQGAGDDSFAMLERALALHREVGDRRMEALDLACIGLVHRERGNGAEARQTLGLAVELLGRVGDRARQAVVRGALGAVVGDLGDAAAALELIRASLAVHRAMGNGRFEAIELGSLANMLVRRGQLDEARTAFQRALALHREYGNRMFEADVLGNLGQLLHREGRDDEAVASLAASRALHREIGNRRSEAMVVTVLGSLRLDRGEVASAREVLDEALTMVRALGDRRYEGIVRTTLGALELRDGNVAPARAHLDRALELVRAASDRRAEAQALTQLARLAARTGAAQEARAWLARGEAILTVLGDEVELTALRAVRAELEATGSGAPGAPR